METPRACGCVLVDEDPNRTHKPNAHARIGNQPALRLLKALKAKNLRSASALVYLGYEDGRANREASPLLTRHPPPIGSAVAGGPALDCHEPGSLYSINMHPVAEASQLRVSGRYAPSALTTAPRRRLPANRARPDNLAAFLHKGPDV
jgi:hypothetical protein